MHNARNAKKYEKRDESAGDAEVSPRGVKKEKKDKDSKDRKEPKGSKRKSKLLMRMRVRIRKPQRQSPVRLRKPKLRSDPLGPAADHLINLAGSLFDFMS